MRNDAWSINEKASICLECSSQCINKIPATGTETDRGSDGSVLLSKHHCAEAYKPRSIVLLKKWVVVERKILVFRWICISNSVITLVDKRPKNRLQLTLIVHKKYLESKNVRYLVTVKLNDGTFIHLISEFFSNNLFVVKERAKF